MIDKICSLIETNDRSDTSNGIDTMCMCLMKVFKQLMELYRKTINSQTKGSIEEVEDDLKSFCIGVLLFLSNYYSSKENIRKKTVQ